MVFSNLQCITQHAGDYMTNKFWLCGCWKDISANVCLSSTPATLDTAIHFNHCFSVCCPLQQRRPPPLTASLYVRLPICCSTCPPLCFWGCPSRLSEKTDGLNCRSSSHSTHHPPPPPPPHFTLKLPLRRCSESEKLHDRICFDTEKTSLLLFPHQLPNNAERVCVLASTFLWFHPSLLRLGEWEHFTLTTTPRTAGTQRRGLKLKNQ